jgi:hypothetical protein
MRGVGRWTFNDPWWANGLANNDNVTADDSLCQARPIPGLTYLARI